MKETLRLYKRMEPILERWNWSLYVFNHVITAVAVILAAVCLAFLVMNWS